jgi:hypothetical protein
MIFSIVEVRKGPSQDIGIASFDRSVARAHDPLKSISKVRRPTDCLGGVNKMEIDSELMKRLG